MNTYVITVMGEPVPKQRVRVVNNHAYTPQKTKDAENKIAFRWVAKYKSKIIENPVCIEIVFAMKKPKAKTTKYVQKRPDIDNLAKTVLDALNGIAYVDDKQVVKLVATKVWADEPSTTIWVREIDDEAK